ncbi:Dam family site-specific DNA-(adenine-N6)-methyltransferase [Lactobacillus delbrueckii]|uniref:Dam family site-specific DNA-(adenine-N6)-methyltransferase n=1 Tax=Lactobacillus delbrueckii TaxID=1584 RepID=UPI0006831BA9|nr:Dam family site-specific DNA-(adenine-N6)-methyltransferase [Lactobacillus delbrueckii]APG73923.1 DNA adenine methylase [Lactobacillus delbrueckii subsp. sunkii]KNE75145.1 DNA adenine methylase [Lactobacillus delbrueckii subsp. sunkii]GHN13085.1 hypothetical protein NRIC0766_12160 [Lactobacillus delbrueckii subsp. sunkii]GHN14308.1 hypothetical protein NRIC0767_05690 [Lactobacillus delbrueckii subsp. sunkii]
MKKVRSPLFYVGDKYKIISQIKEKIPQNINTFYDVFAGGGSASMGVNAYRHKMNDIDTNIVSLHRYLMEQVKDLDAFIEHMYDLIHYYKLTCSALNELPKNFLEVKKAYPKTYYAKLNKEGYLQLRNDYNSDQSNIDLLYLLLVYGFNHMTRFNRAGMFNLPVGNVDWNKNVESALRNYAEYANNNNVSVCNYDFEKFVLNQKIEANDFLYFDPPYLITFSEYNKMWDNNTENRLYNLLDILDEKGAKWGLSNVLTHKGKTNQILADWIENKNYNVYSIKSNYISKFDNTIKDDTKEVFITNS